MKIPRGCFWTRWRASLPKSGITDDQGALPPPEPINNLWPCFSCRPFPPVKGDIHPVYSWWIISDGCGRTQRRKPMKGKNLSAPAWARPLGHGWQSAPTTLGDETGSLVAHPSPLFHRAWERGSVPCRWGDATGEVKRWRILDGRRSRYLWRVMVSFAGKPSECPEYPGASGRVHLWRVSGVPGRGNFLWVWVVASETGVGGSIPDGGQGPAVGSLWGDGAEPHQAGQPPPHRIVRWGDSVSVLTGKTI